MAVLTDLTWQQLADQLPANAVTITNGKVTIDTSLVTDKTVDVLDSTGVVKFFSVLFTAANKAQITANEGQENGEKLTAFSPATIGTAADGFMTLTRPFVCRAELTSAVNIIGTNG